MSGPPLFSQSSAPVESLSQISSFRRGGKAKPGQCQRCLGKFKCFSCSFAKKLRFNCASIGYGHWTYECKATSRPYVHRPSRTSQLAKPSLALNRSTPRTPFEDSSDPASRAGLADAILKQRKRRRKEEKDSSSESSSSDSDSSDSDSSSSSESSSDSSDSDTSSDSSSNSSGSESDSASSDSSGARRKKRRRREKRKSGKRD